MRAKECRAKLVEQNPASKCEKCAHQCVRRAVTLSAGRFTRPTETRRANRRWNVDFDVNRLVAFAYEKKHDTNSRQRSVEVNDKKSKKKNNTKFGYRSASIRNVFFFVARVERLYKRANVCFCLQKRRTEHADREYKTTKFRLANNHNPNDE